MTYAGELDFGTEAEINYLDLKLAWFDRFLKGMNTEVSDWRPVRIFTMGTGDGRRVIDGAPREAADYPGKIHHGGFWRSLDDWPISGTRFTPFDLQADGTLSPENPEGRTFPPVGIPSTPGTRCPRLAAEFQLDIVMKPGAFDQRGRSGSMGCTDRQPLGLRSDVLTFQTPPLDRTRKSPVPSKCTSGHRRRPWIRTLPPSLSTSIRPTTTTRTDWPST